MLLSLKMPAKFTRPAYPAGAVMDYGVQVFAPPSPCKQQEQDQYDVAVTSSPKDQNDYMHSSQLSTSPNARRQLDFGANNDMAK